MYLNCKIIFITSLMLICAAARKKRSNWELESCLLGSGEIGICIPIDDCPSALRLIENGGDPELCEFAYDEPIVCCNFEEPKSSPRIETVARQKCSEYKTTSIPTTTTTTTTEAVTYIPGMIPPRKFVTAGVNAEPLEFPHMAILGYGNEDNIIWQCAGSLISESFVLTAAHCIDSRQGPVAFVNLGLHQLSTITSFVQKFRVKNTTAHPDYSPAQEYHDIALIELDRPADIRSGVKPACLQTSRDLPDDIPIATGWGATSFGGGNNDVLQKVNLTYVPFNKCKVTYRSQIRLKEGLNDEWQLCSGGVTTRGDTCQGDSGGPLQIKSEEPLYSVVGITSFGINCGLVPGVYTRVSYYVPWIESIVWKDHD